MTFTTDHDALIALVDETARPADQNDAFAFLMGKYYGRLRRQVHSVLRINPRLVGLEEDITQETFIRLHARARQLACSEWLTPDVSLCPWLSRVAFRKALDALRRPAN